MARYNLEVLATARPRPQRLPLANVRIKQQDAALGQERAMMVFGWAPVRIGGLGRHPHLLPAARGD